MAATNHSTTLGLSLWEQTDCPVGGLFCRTIKIGTAGGWGIFPTRPCT